jgi:hypothetical protein
VTVEEGGDDPAVQDVPRSCGVFGSGLPSGNGNVTIPVALELESHRVVSTATPAIVVDHHVLEGLI